jgi:hypothetical protein
MVIIVDASRATPDGAVLTINNHSGSQHVIRIASQEAGTISQPE